MSTIVVKVDFGDLKKEVISFEQMPRVGETLWWDGQPYEITYVIHRIHRAANGNFWATPSEVHCVEKI